MAIILTEHAKQRIELRGCPDPTKVRVKKATDKDIKQLNIGRRLKPRKCAFLYKTEHDCYIYIGLHSVEDVVILTAYKFSNYFSPTGNRKRK